MKKALTILPVLTLTTILSIAISSCKKEEIENRRTLKQLYKTYKNGAISECTHNGQTVYSAILNIYDAGGTVYDKDGKQMESCNYAWGKVDQICGQVIGCQVIYRVKNNIWGLPAVDTYGLGN